MEFGPMPPMPPPLPMPPPAYPPMANAISGEMHNSVASMIVLRIGWPPECIPDPRIVPMGWRRNDRNTSDRHSQFGACKFDDGFSIGAKAIYAVTGAITLQTMTDFPLRSLLRHGRKSCGGCELVLG